jgi:hypothetical protein
MLGIWAYNYDWGGVPPVETPIVGNPTYYNPPTYKKKSYDEFIDKYFEVLETVSPTQELEAPQFTPQKQVIASNIIRQINALDLFDTFEIQMAIRQAEIDYYNYLAKMREIDDEACLMLLLN